MTGVMLSRTMAPMPLFTVHGRVHPSLGIGVVVGARLTPNCARGPSVALG
jgi:hypothetical protein